MTTKELSGNSLIDTVELWASLSFTAQIYEKKWDSTCY